MPADLAALAEGQGRAGGQVGFLWIFILFFLEIHKGVAGFKVSEFNMKYLP